MPDDRAADSAGKWRAKSKLEDLGDADAPFRRVCVVGLGYVGLPTAAILAACGINVVGVDIDPDRVRIVNSGATPIAEPDLATLLDEAMASGRLRAQETVVAAEAFVIAVPTPLKADHVPDLNHLRDAVTSVAEVLVCGNLVVLESTSPVGATHRVCEWLAHARPDLSFPHEAGEASDIRVAYSPERILPGDILDELVNNDRTVGGVTPACAQAAISLYRHFVRGTCSVTTARTAELVKLAENAYRDLNVAFANEISLICYALDLDPWETIELANQHPRVNILRPGPGVGGHCIAVDPWFLVHSASGRTPLIQAARQVNDAKPLWVVNQVLAACDGLDRPQVACLGLAYKADVGDLRGSPAVTIVQRLSEMAPNPVAVVEPNIETLPEELNTAQIELVDLGDALSVANVVVLLTDHREFREIERQSLRNKRLVDTRGVWRARSSHPRGTKARIPVTPQARDCRQCP